MVDASKDHVFTGKPILDKKSNTFLYSGCHTKSGLEQMIKENGGGKYTLRDLKINPVTGVYEGAPEIKFNDGRIAVKSGNGGICSFFPDSWSGGKIEAEVKYAANNIVGKIKDQQNMYIGRTKDGKISIVIQFRTYVNKKGEVIKKITSFYPLYE